MLPHNAPPDRPIVIIGAGVAGLALGKLLNDLHLPYVILEKNQDVGGSWWENTYPGAGVDTPSHAYSFSFGKSHRWSRYFSPQHEIQDSLSDKADEFNIRPNIRFGVEVKQVDWQDVRRRLRAGFNNCGLVIAVIGEKIHDAGAWMAQV